MERPTTWFGDFQGHQMLRTVLVAALCSFAASHVQAQTPSNGHWVGSARLNGAAMPMEVMLENDAAVIVLPDLLWSGTVETSTTDEAVTFELPFGLGPTQLRLMGANRVLASDEDAPAITLRRDDAQRYAVEDFQIPGPSGDIAATLYSPAGAQSRGVVVLAGGATAQSRAHRSVTGWCRYFVRLNLTCLAADRKVDGSGGPNASDLERDTAELAATLAWLRARPEQGSSPIGIAAFSRGAWPALRVAAQDRHIAFLLMSGASLSSPAAAEVLSVEARMRAAGRTEAEIEAVKEYYRLYFAVAETGRDWPQLDRAARQAENAPWGEFADQPLEIGHLGFWSRNGAFSNADDLPRVTAPILSVWGEFDRISPPVAHRPTLEAVQPNAAIRIYANADHPVEIQPGPDAFGVWRWPAKAPGMLSEIDAWLADILSRRPDTPGPA